MVLRVHACDELTPSASTRKASKEAFRIENPGWPRFPGFFYALPKLTAAKEGDMKRRIYDNVMFFSILLTIGLAYASCLNDFGNFA